MPDGSRLPDPMASSSGESFRGVGSLEALRLRQRQGQDARLPWKFASLPGLNGPGQRIENRRICLKKRPAQS